MVWAAFSEHSFTSLLRCDSAGSITSARYVQILTKQLLPNMQFLLPDGGHFQQDNAPIHTARNSKDFF